MGFDDYRYDDFHEPPEFQTPGRVRPLAGYEMLAKVLDEALEQAQTGKGRERHQRDREPFDQQPMVEIARVLGPAFMAGQIAKKLDEVNRMEHSLRRRELIGVINYLAGMVIFWDRVPAASAYQATPYALALAYPDPNKRGARPGACRGCHTKTPPGCKQCDGTGLQIVTELKAVEARIQKALAIVNPKPVNTDSDFRPPRLDELY